MTPQKELEFLKGFIQLSNEEATKRDNLQAFCSGKSKVLLVDADSMLYNVVYSHQTALKETGIIDLGQQFKDFEKQIDAVKYQVENEGFEVEEIIYFFTTCRNNFRKKLLPTYKANRPFNQMGLLVSLLKHHVIEMLEMEGKSVQYCDEQEADDLIALHSRYAISNGIIVAIDKDLRQIPGAHFNYYKDKVKDEEGNPVMEWVELDNGESVYIQKRVFRGWSFTTENEGFKMLLTMLLVGDTSDNIKGVDGIGPKKAEKLLKDKNNFGMLRAVYQAYNDKSRLALNIQLMKL